jgi:hypothetical protein
MSHSVIWADARTSGCSAALRKESAMGAAAHPIPNTYYQPSPVHVLIEWAVRLIGCDSRGDKGFSLVAHSKPADSPLAGFVWMILDIDLKPIGSRIVSMTIFFRTGWALLEVTT